jgi:hypothetical protein
MQGPGERVDRVFEECILLRLASRCPEIVACVLSFLTVESAIVGLEASRQIRGNMYVRRQARVEEKNASSSFGRL